MLGRGLGPFSASGLKKASDDTPVRLPSPPPSRSSPPLKTDESSRDTVHAEAPIGTSLEGLARKRRNDAELQQRLTPAFFCQGLPLGGPDSKEAEPDCEVFNGIGTHMPARSLPRRSPSQGRRGVPRRMPIPRKEEVLPPASPWLAVKALVPAQMSKKEQLPTWHCGPKQGFKIVTLPQPSVGAPG